MSLSRFLSCSRRGLVFGAVLASVLGASNSAFGYDDDYVTIPDDDSVRTNWVGDRVVYIFTNTASAATATFKQNMTLQEVLIVGGGGAGGGFKGGGGGGGGVIDLTSPTLCVAGSTATVSVGKGGIGNANRASAKPPLTNEGAGYGSPSSLMLGGSTTTAYGGGGGGSDRSDNGNGWPSKITADIVIGCGGGAGAWLIGTQTSEYYTDGQGCYGGTGAGNNVNGGTGGGGGALTPGQNATSSRSGDGGEGVTNSITGVAEVYGSGGGGGGAESINSGACDPGVGGTHAGNGVKGKVPNKAGSGEDGFGAGGGGGGYDGGASDGGDGGSGTVILAFTVGGQASKPEFDEDDITVTFPDGLTQPHVAVKAGGEQGATYQAVFLVLCGTDDNFASTNVHEKVRCGDEPGAFAFLYPQPGETFTVKVIASADGVDDTVVTKEVTVPTDQGLVVPSHVGKGGGAGVIHVRVGAHGRNNGSCWTDAYTDFRAAIKELSEDRRELWFCGDETVGATAETISPATNATIRGGFAGSEDTPSERAKAAKSQLDGQDLYDCLAFDNARGKGVVVDGFLFTQGRSHGLVKTGAGDITVTNCSFDANGLTQMIEGRAMSLSDKTYAAGATIVDCRISNHRDVGSEAAGKAGALYLNGLSAATLSDCLFTSNGLAFGTTPFGAHPGRSGCWGSALAVDATPVTVERCEFRANVALSGNVLGTDVGGLVNLRGNCGESVFRNCAWVGNEVLYTRVSKESEDSNQDFEGGVLVVDVTDDSTVAVENCTFAGNLYEGHYSTAGLNVRTGTVNLKDSIFFANFSGNTCGDISPADLRVQAGATAHVTYTMFGGETNRLADAGGTLDIGVGYVDDDPLFATTAEVYASCRTLTGGHYYYTAESAPTLLAADIHESANSPALDTGDPQSPYKNELKPNGRRVNLGRYGNTPEAMTTKTGLTLIIR